ncbi:MAG: hypothetical protein PHN72_02115 [Bacilli bacterium]|nr:hypothetical protein [Bacilli bacterium]
MFNLNSINVKLDKIKKTINNNGIKNIIIWLNEDEPIRFDLMYENKIKYVYCNNIEEYIILDKKYDNIEKLIIKNVDKPKFDIPTI